MPIFSYTAKNSEGKDKGGQMQASSKVEVAKTLRGEGFVPVTIEKKRLGVEKGSSGNKTFLEQIMKFDVGKVLDRVRGVPLADKIMFSRHLAIMISSGVAINRALEVLSKQTENTRFKQAILKIRSDIQGGGRISDSFAKYPDIFDALYVSMVCLPLCL